GSADRDAVARRRPRPFHRRRVRGDAAAPGPVSQRRVNPDGFCIAPEGPAGNPCGSPGRIIVGIVTEDHVGQYWDQGYAVLRGFLPKAAVGELQQQARRIYAEGLKHPTTYRDRNLLFEVLPESFRGRRYVLQAHWIAWISPYFEELRRSQPY